jgi:hypothetical protein
MTASIIQGERLNQAETAWFERHGGLEMDPYLLTGHQKYVLFDRLWTTNKNVCKTCGQREGYCTEATCIRLRVTHKLGLQNMDDWERS